VNGNPKVEITTVIDNFLPLLHQQKPLPNHHLRTLHALQRCRTETMGGRVEHCNQCGNEQVIYNSCRNRHCPKCGSIDRERWLAEREADLLPVNYLHVVFTLPDKLNHLFLHHQVDCYNILFQVVNQVMTGFAVNPKFLDARIGYTAILHTWGQNLQYHPHLHLLVPAGGITRNNKWKSSKGEGSFLFPVDKMSRVFRAKMVDALRRYVRTEQVKIEPGLLGTLFDKEWVVYVKPPFAGPKQVLSYLGRYTHRVAISNDRILKVNDRQVTFSWRDYHQDYKKIITTMDGTDFLKRFTLHILPPGFTRIRHYGFLSSAAKTKALAALREYFCLPVVTKYIKITWQTIAREKMGIEAQCCKKCGHLMHVTRIIPDHFHQPIRAPSYAAYY
jgi:hypothetical protein